jgi:hypothetical protein
MKKIPSIVLFCAAVLLLITAIGMAEFALRVSVVIPKALFLAIPVAGILLSIISIVRARPLQDGRAMLAVGVALVVAIAPMVFLSTRYEGDFDPLAGRLAPDGSEVTSLTWNEENGKYVERINRRFERQLTESEFHDITVNLQRKLLVVLVAFSSLAFCTSLVTVVLERR